MVYQDWNVILLQLVIPTECTARVERSPFVGVGMEIPRLALLARDDNLLAVF